MISFYFSFLYWLLAKSKVLGGIGLEIVYGCPKTPLLFSERQGFCVVEVREN